MFWTQIALVIAGPTLLIGVVVLVFFGTRPDTALEFSGTGDATSIAFEQGEDGQFANLCVTGRLAPVPEALDGVNALRARLVDASGATLRRTSTLVGESGGSNCSGSGSGALPPGSYHVEVEAPEHVFWTASARRVDR